MTDSAGANRWIIEQNITRFSTLLQHDLEIGRRREIERLLADERRKLAAIGNQEQERAK